MILGAWFYVGASTEFAYIMFINKDFSDDPRSQ